MSEHFKFEEKVSEKLGEDMMKYLETYEDTCMDFELSDAKKIQPLHNLFGNGAKRFFGDKVAPAFNFYVQVMVFVI